MRRRRVFTLVELPAVTKREREAFTLVELLVLVGIIAVLISILLPVLGRAREQARIVKCANNIRQVYNALAMYANENKGALPVINTGWDPATWRSYFAIRVLNNGQFSYTEGALWPYVAASAATRQEIFLCPSDGPHRVAGTGIVYAPDPRYPRNFSYCFNEELQGVGHGGVFYTGIPLSRIRRPGNKIIILEMQNPVGTLGGFSGAGPVGDGSWAMISFLSRRHLGLGNQGFADGHVELMSPRVFEAPAGWPSIYTEAYYHYAELFEDR